jgi:hypothetical protein
MAKEYVNKYLNGRCKEDVERALSGEEPREESEAALDAGAGVWGEGRRGRPEAPNAQPENAASVPPPLPSSSAAPPAP